MAKHILVVNGHPDPAPERLCAALAKAYCEGAEMSGHIADRIDVGGREIPLLRQPGEFLTPPDDPFILEARQRILGADHLVFVFPLWLGGLPALLKAFLEQVSRAEYALGANDKGFPIGKLKGRSARVMVTLGMPAPIYRIFFGGHGVKALNRGILGLAGVRPIRTSYFGSIGNAGRASRALATARALGRRGA